MKDNSHVTHEFGLSHLTKIEEHTRVLARECQLRHELYRILINVFEGMYPVFKQETTKKAGQL